MMINLHWFCPYHNLVFYFLSQHESNPVYYHNVTFGETEYLTRKNVTRLDFIRQELIGSWKMDV